MTNWYVFMGIAGAMALWLGFPNDLADMPPLVLFWPAVLGVLGLKARDGGGALRAGWLCGLAGHAAALYWLALPVHIVGGLPWPLALPCVLFVAACLSFANGIFTWAAYMSRLRPPLICAFTLALIWYLLEYVCARLLGFPWLPLTGALAVWPILIQAADIFGAYALSGLWTLVVLLCLVFFRYRICLALGLALAVCLLVYGAWRLDRAPFTAEPAGTESISALFVEGNIDQNQKWIPAFQQASLDAYVNLTRAGLAKTPPGEKPIVVWPETALPFFFEHTPKYDQAVRDLVAENGCPLLLGAPGVETAANGQRAIFNRAFLLSPKGAPPRYTSGHTTGRYDKTHLVPFGEYLPSWLDFAFLQALLQGVGVYEEGKSGQPLRYGKLALGMLICYEAIFPWLAEDRVKNGANILVDISNDAWFGHTPAARQHLYLAVLRAVEQGRWFLRGTNTGISAVADHRGRLTMRGGQFVAGSHFVRAALLDTASPYSRLAPWIFPLALAGFAVLLLAGWKRHRLVRR